MQNCCLCVLAIDSLLLRRELLPARRHKNSHYANTATHKIAIPMLPQVFIEKYKFALLLGLALLFHVIGLVGIGFLHSEALLKTTPLHLLLMCGLLLWSNNSGKAFWWWAGGTFCAGLCGGMDWY